MMTGAEVTSAHREKVAREVACLVADVMQARGVTEEVWRAEAGARFTDGAPFRARIGHLMQHLERYIAEATQAAALEWRDDTPRSDGWCHVVPITEDFAREFRERVMVEAREVIKLREARKSRRPHGAKVK